MTDNSTIYALATPAGNGAIAVIRLSGGDALHIADSLFRGKNKLKRLATQKNYTIHFGSLVHKDETLDEVLISLFKSPHSYTGEDVVEISCHGSVYIQQRIMQALSECGARLAQPGEFTMRAFLNGKMDLSQAEAVADLIASQSAASHKIAFEQMKGGFSSQLEVLRGRLLHFISLIELELDFSEEDVEFADRTQFHQLLAEINTHISQLINSFSYGNVVRTGVPVAIAGRTNVGKSTLLNALLNEEKAIVSDIAGTTRDVIEDTMVMDGITFRFIDTAGIRHTTDTIESLGIERTFERIARARIILYVCEATDNIADIQKGIEGIALKEDQHLVVVLNKYDLLSDKELADKQDKLRQFDVAFVFLSAKNKLHINTLQKEIVAIVQSGKTDSGVIVTNVRHYEALQQAQQAVNRVFEGLQSHISTDLIAQDLREVLYHIGEITGEITTNEVLGNIFKNFCIGK
ncbi:MAG TPA: tRNA uridine-5-carboxymethylaminomethyl(34) synthesis GTPase MnmE [Bacteroidales bacterium]|nr:tRNA uridine-5-carboxymethylaminomethyl(34) synthesis GTPase MnmE [Bacteroidales bacterium]